MSLSKTKLPASAEEPQRQPKCTRCRYHGLIVPQKGHLRLCPFLRCRCPKCLLIAERTRITTLQRNLRTAGLPCAGPGDWVTNADAGNESAPAGGARPLATSHKCNDAAAPESDGTTTAAQIPLDLRSEAAVRREIVARFDRTHVRASSSSEALCNVTPFSVPYCGELSPSAPVPFIPFPVRMCGHYPSSYGPCPAFMVNMPSFPHVPAGQYIHGLYRPLTLPHFQEGAVHYPPLPEPRPPHDYVQGFFTLQPPRLPEAFQEELRSTQSPEPPLAKHLDPDTQAPEPPLAKHPDPDTQAPEPPLAKHPDPDTQAPEPPLAKHPDPDIVEVD